jgi:gamma-tubulin complex component 2
MAVCTLFANYTASFSRNVASSDPDLAKTEAGKAEHDPHRLEKLDDNLKRFEDNFTRHLKILLDALNYLAATETVVFLGLCARLSMANENVPAPSTAVSHG